MCLAKLNRVRFSLGWGQIPGVGKTTIARKLAQAMIAVHLRIDTIETAIANSDLHAENTDAGYLVAYGIAKDNLLLGLTVVADSVNAIEITRKTWREVAQSAGSSFIEVEVTCSDAKEHQTRVESRIADIQGHKLPNWQKVVNTPYEEWDLQGVRLDSSTHSADQCVETILALLNTQPS